MSEPLTIATLKELVRTHLPGGATSLRLTPIRTGKHNASFWVDSDQGRFVLRVAPPDDAGFLFYERRMMRQEPNLHHLISKRTTIPVAEVVAADFSRSHVDSDYLLLMALPGTPLSDATGLDRSAKNRLSSYLAQLQDLRLVERRLPATVPTARQHRSRMGRYHLSDPFLRFHFRFLEPYAQEGILSYQPERVLPAIQRDLRAFVGTAWEELARQWVLAQRATDVLGFTPEVVGSHWSRTVQIDVVAINWQTHDILLGECKWGAEAIDRKTVRELLAKAPLVLTHLPSDGAKWRVHYASFTRAGATPAARNELAAHDGILVDLARRCDDLTAADAHWLVLGPDIQLRHTPYDLALAAERIAATTYPGAQEFVQALLHPPSEGEMPELFTPWELT